MNRKFVFIAASLALAAGTASAQSITFNPGETVVFELPFNPDGGVFASGAYTSGTEGTFVADGDGQFSLTFLGQESALDDQVTITVNGNTLTELNAIGDSITGPMVAGTPLDFTFSGEGGSFAENGGPSDERGSFALLDTDVETSQGTFAYVVGYNDSAIHDDWDDFVVGLNPVAPIPEPQTYALLLAGLGVVGFVTRRRRAR